MKRLLQVLGGLLALVLIAFLGIGYLSYGLSDAPPKRLAVAGLSGPATVAWPDADAARIRATTWPDALRALGVAHGQDRTWLAVLLRQVALGQTSRWFGEATAPIDALAHQLGFERLARLSYEQLPPDERALVDAYTAGLNASLTTASARTTAELTLLDRSPAAWAPADVLAVERLLLWLATPLPDLPETSSAGGPATKALSSFTDAAWSLRDLLRLHGFEHSLAWFGRGADGARFYQRHTYGDAALPLLYPVRFTVGDTVVHAATVPGTLAFPAGQAPDHAWSTLLHASARFLPGRPVPASLRPIHDRLVLADGNERLSTSWRGDSLLFLPDTASADTAWALRWPGLHAGTDLTAWLALLNAEPPTFRLLRGDGLRLRPSGEVDVLGRPRLAYRLRDGVLISNDSLARYAAAHLDSLLASTSLSSAFAPWRTDAYSRWAAERAPRLIDQLDVSPVAAQPLRDAEAFLRNWDHAYDDASIAASIFEAWLHAYLDLEPSLPAPSDSSSVTQIRLMTALEEALRDLEATYGPDPNLWRWEMTGPRTRVFPVWGTDLPLPRGAGGRYDPLVVPGFGHPTTLVWGPSRLRENRPAPSSWDVWLRLDAWDEWMVRPAAPRVDAFLGRLQSPDPARRALPFGIHPVRSTTTLLPATTP